MWYPHSQRWGSDSTTNDCDTLDSFPEYTTVEELVEALEVLGSVTQGTVLRGHRPIDEDECVSRWGRTLDVHQGSFGLQMRVWPKGVFRAFLHAASHKKREQTGAFFQRGGRCVDDSDLASRMLACTECIEHAKRYGFPFSTPCMLAVRTRVVFADNSGPALNDMVSLALLLPENVYQDQRRVKSAGWLPLNHYGEMPWYTYGALGITMSKPHSNWRASGSPIRVRPSKGCCASSNEWDVLYNVRYEIQALLQDGVALDLKELIQSWDLETGRETGRDSRRGRKGLATRFDCQSFEERVRRNLTKKAGFAHAENQCKRILKCAQWAANDIYQLNSMLNTVALLAGEATYDALPAYYTNPLEYPLLIVMALRMASRSEQTVEMHDLSQRVHITEESQPTTPDELLAMYEFNQLVERSWTPIEDTDRTVLSLAIDLHVRSTVRNALSACDCNGMYTKTQLEIANRQQNWMISARKLLLYLFSPSAYDQQNSATLQQIDPLADAKLNGYRKTTILPPSTMIGSKEMRLPWPACTVSRNRMRDTVVELVYKTESAFRTFLLEKDSSQVSTHKSSASPSSSSLEVELDAAFSTTADEKLHEKNFLLPSARAQTTEPTPNKESMHKAANVDMMTLQNYASSIYTGSEYASPFTKGHLCSNSVAVRCATVTKHALSHGATPSTLGKPATNGPVDTPRIEIHAPLIKESCLRCAQSFGSIQLVLPTAYARCTTCNRIMCLRCSLARTREDVQSWVCDSCNMD